METLLIIPKEDFEILASKLDYFKSIFPEFELLDVNDYGGVLLPVQISIGNASEIWNLAKLIQIERMEDKLIKK